MIEVLLLSVGSTRAHVVGAEASVTRSFLPPWPKQRTPRAGLGRKPGLGVCQCFDQADHLVMGKQPRRVSPSDQPKRSVHLDVAGPPDTDPSALVDDCNCVVPFSPREGLGLTHIPRSRAKNAGVLSEYGEIIEAFNTCSL